MSLKSRKLNLQYPGLLHLTSSAQAGPAQCRQTDRNKRMASYILFLNLLLFAFFSFGSAEVVNAACIDNDGDGYGSPGDISCSKGSKTDCDDADSLVYPNAPKICDGKDSNCDGLKDFASDEDKDLDGVMWCANDCDDYNAARFPGNYEIYGTPACTDGIDNDCNSKADNADPTCTTPCIDKDSDGYGFPGTIYCSSGSSVNDCSDNNASINPGRVDNDCNGIDNNCNGQVDESFIVTTTNCGVGICATTGQNICQNGTPVNTCIPLPAGFEGPVGAPSCSDGIDNNCNGAIDGADGFCMNFCIDVDGDGYGANGAAVCPMGAIVDCNDSNANINPGMTDTTCNGVDENCSGANDEGYVPTATSCGVGACANTGQNLCQSGTIVNTCTQHAAGTEGPLGRPTCTDSIDNNCDGFTDLADPNCQVSCIDKDNDGYGNPGDVACPKGSKTDCNDNDPKVYFGAPKICDGKDNNCDGVRDFSTDIDQDGDGVMWCANDCDDRNANKFPGNYEIYGTAKCSDGIDNDCNNKTDLIDPTCTTPCIDKDGDGYGKPGTIYCSGGSATDCNDTSAAINPGASDANCNGLDNNCNGQIDEAFASSTTTCGIGACVNTGQTSCVSGVLQDSCMPLAAGFEGPYGSLSCSDEIDNNCNGQIDGADGFCMNVCIDSDGDGYGANGASVCPIPLMSDCDDTDPNINPGVTDTTCNGVDENCSGAADEGYVPTATSCGAGGCSRSGQLVCQSGSVVNTCTPGAPGSEGPLGQPNCSDGIDNNCDGLTDANDPRCQVSCIDMDHDGYGNPGDATCQSGNKTDCDDNDNKVFPGAAKICDAKDNNCDGIKDFATDEDKDHDGVPWCASDCDDNNANRFPGNPEGPYGLPTCSDGIDNDCDLKVDIADPECAAPSCNTKNTPRDGVHMFDLKDQATGNTIMIACTWCHLDALGNDMKPKCQRCHADPTDTSDPLNGVLKQQYPGNPPYGFGTAKNVKLHASSVVGVRNGTWAPTCLTCHNPHLQEQNAKFGTTYGKYVKEYVCFDNTANGGSNTKELIKFTSATGSGSFTDGVPYNENVCEMCHTKTKHHTRTGNAPRDLDAGGNYIGHHDSENCTVCHTHDNGFVLSCGTCHELPPPTGTHLKHFSGTPDEAVYGSTNIAKDVTTFNTGYIFNCGNCHPMDITKHFNDIPNSGGGSAEIEFYNPNAPAGSIKALNPPSASYIPGGTVYTDAKGLKYTNGTCNNVYCHSGPQFTTSGTVPVGVQGTPPNNYPLIYNPPWESFVIESRSYKSPVWGAGPFSCDGCHGYPILSRYPTVSAGVGDSHAWIDDRGYLDLHMWNMGSNPLQCSVCHYDTVRADYTWIRDDYSIQLGNIGIYNDVKHVNGAKEVVFTPNSVKYVGLYTKTYYPANTTFDPATKTCTTAPCHRLQTTVKWGQPYRYWTDECYVCHRL